LSLLLFRLSYVSSLMANLGTTCNRSLLSTSRNKLVFLHKVGRPIVNKHSLRMQRVTYIATPNFYFVVHIPDQDSQQNYWWLLSHLICNVPCCLRIMAAEDNGTPWSWIYLVPIDVHVQA
jgi:hypothetical protein